MVEERRNTHVTQSIDLMPFTQVKFLATYANAMTNQWKDIIIIHILRNPWYYSALQTRFDLMWSPRKKIELVDLGHGCYYLKALLPEKREMILTERPWHLAGNYLSIRKWKPNFRADSEKVESVITLVRILNLLLEYFRELMIEMLATILGDMIKIDGNTYNAMRGKFARFCVQVCTEKPLQLGLCISGKICQIAYENLPYLCHKCGRAGHQTNRSEEKVNKSYGPEGSSSKEVLETDHAQEKKSSGY